MRARTYITALFAAAKLILLAGTVAAALWLGGDEEWHPTAVVALLVLLSLLGQWLSVEIRRGELSASLVAIVLAMGVLGPAPAAACGVAAMILTSASRQLRAANWLNNLSTFAAVPFAGGLIVRAGSDIHQLHRHGLTHSLTFGLTVFAAFTVAVALTFALFALDLTVEEGGRLDRHLRELVPLLPGELAAGMLATVLAVAYVEVGLPMLIGSIVVLLIFQQLTVALLRSEDRAEQLSARSRQLVGLQLGVLRTLIRALSMRDTTTARHAAAVAKYAKALAAEVGCDEDEQDLIHTAGLLHDIGKFTWPDRILHATALEPQDVETVQRHPQDGAMLVGTLDGYGAIADAILYHHERADGRGYPAGLIGSEIPIGSRILAVCSSYDTMTAGGGYRAAMAPEEAMSELRNGARNGQLDGELVESFIGLLRREGPTFAREADFESELEFERRVRAIAEPRSPTTAPRGFYIGRPARLRDLGARLASGVASLGGGHHS